MFTEEHGRFLAELERIRKEIIEEVPDAGDRKSLLGKLVDDESFEYFRTNGPAAWRERAQRHDQSSHGEGLTFGTRPEKPRRCTSFPRTKTAAESV